MRCLHRLTDSSLHHLRHPLAKTTKLEVWKFNHTDTPWIIFHQEHWRIHHQSHGVRRPTLHLLLQRHNLCVTDFDPWLLESNLHSLHFSKETQDMLEKQDSTNVFKLTISHVICNMVQCFLYLNVDGSFHFLTMYCENLRKKKHSNCKTLLWALFCAWNVSLSTLKSACKEST